LKIKYLRVRSIRRWFPLMYYDCILWKKIAFYILQSEKKQKQKQKGIDNKPLVTFVF